MWKIDIGFIKQCCFVARAENSNAPCPGGYDQTFNGGDSDLYIGKLLLSRK